MRFVIAIILLVAIIPFAAADACDNFGLIASSTSIQPGSSVTFGFDAGTYLQCAEQNYAGGNFQNPGNQPTITYEFDADGDSSWDDTGSFTITEQGTNIYTHTFDTAGTYTATLRISYRNSGTSVIANMDTSSVQIQVQASPPPSGPSCGDGTCSGSETTATCPVDCPSNPPPPPPGTQDGFVETNAIATGGQIHLCGPNWADKPNTVNTHGLCDEVTTASYTVTCSANASGWRWYKTADGVPSIANPSPTYSLIQSSLTPTQQGWSAITCGNGQPGQGVSKYSPPPALIEGNCNAAMCFDGNNCVMEGAAASNYVCQQINGEGWWVSPVTRAGQAVLRYASTSSDYILNCGPKQFAINKQDAPDELGYCELAHRSGPLADQIFIAVAYAQPPANITQPVTDILRTEVERIHPDTSCLDDVPHTCNWLAYNESLNVLIFTDANSLSPGFFGSFWDTVRGIFTSSTSTSIVTRSGSHLYIDTTSNTQSAVEYIADTQCSSGREITSTGECFTQEGWRGVIRTR